MAYLPPRPVAVVGEGLDDYRHAPRTRSLVSAHLAKSSLWACAPLHGAVYITFRHVCLPRLADRLRQPRIGGVPTTSAAGGRNLRGQFNECLRSLRILRALSVTNVVPLAVTRKAPSRRTLCQLWTPELN